MARDCPRSNSRPSMSARRGTAPASAMPSSRRRSGAPLRTSGFSTATSAHRRSTSVRASASTARPRPTPSASNAGWSATAEEPALGVKEAFLSPRDDAAGEQGRVVDLDRDAVADGQARALLDDDRLEPGRQSGEQVRGEEHRVVMAMAREDLGGRVADDEEVATGRDRGGQAAGDLDHAPVGGV